jgi:hypothetical protein
MGEAVRLYSSLGFRPIEPYLFNPFDGAIFLGLDLCRRDSSFPRPRGLRIDGTCTAEHRVGLQ